METSNHDKKAWVTPKLVVHGDVELLTSEGLHLLEDIWLLVMAHR